MMTPVPDPSDSPGFQIAELWVQALVGLGTLVVALAALYVARRSHRTEKESFLADIRRQWEGLDADWNRVLMYVYGPDFYYHTVPPDERRTHSALLRELGDADAPAEDDRRDTAARLTRTARLRRRFHDFLRWLRMAGPGVAVTAEEAIPRDEWPEERRWQWVRWQRGTVFRVARFYSYASDALLTGRWTLGEAYALFGPEVARHFDTIVWMSGRKTVSEVLYAPGGQSQQWLNWIDSLRESNFHDHHDTLLVLAYALRAEQCRRADTYAHFVASLAHAMRTDAGSLVRRALWRSSRVRRRLWPRPSLLWSMHRAQYPLKRSAFSFDGIYLQPHDYPVFRRPYESTLGNEVRIARMTARRDIY